ncbi:hypothetical protein FGO68_gene4425 [Halteria grandinella]|uniref:Uncharacterized protein n=1 Tax=Halteria grandinella TaxID=5974 RepID=A0A8J8NIW9_HALGN|nr:hypothetical protein FGO68_gene4425 [Halteria grandinella]
MVEAKNVTTRSFISYRVKGVDDLPVYVFLVFSLQLLAVLLLLLYVLILKRQLKATKKKAKPEPLKPILKKEISSDALLSSSKSINNVLSPTSTGMKSPNSKRVSFQFQPKVVIPPHLIAEKKKAQEARNLEELLSILGVRTEVIEPKQQCDIEPHVSDIDVGWNGKKKVEFRHTVSPNKASDFNGINLTGSPTELVGQE